MKASEVLTEYQAGRRNFQGVNLRGQSFKGEDLKEADFSRADIRGANFNNTILRQTNFTRVKAGLPKQSSWLFLVVSLLLSGLSGLLLLIAISNALNFFSRNFSSDIPGVTYDPIAGTSIILTYVTFITVVIRRDILSAFGSLMFVFVVSVAIETAFSNLVSNPLLIPASVGVAAANIATIAVSGVVASGIAIIVTNTQTRARATILFGTSIGFIYMDLAILTSAKPSLEMENLPRFIIALAVAIAIIIHILLIGIPLALLNFYVARCSLKGESKYALFRGIILYLVAIGGTRFCSADLTDADFTEANLKSSNFRKANLIRTDWSDVQKLDYARVGETYLKNVPLRQLLLTGEGQNQNYDRQDLRGVNLQGANLTNASFIDTDLSQADLQEANLFEAKLVQTNLDKANLSNANLTGAYLEDWGITRNTIFNGVKGDYVYQRLPTKENRDPHRMPPSKQGNFSENDLYIFITSVLDTLDLYHRQNINAGVAITVLKGLTEDYPVQFELVGIEKRGDNKFVIRLKVFGPASHFQLQSEYYARYEQILPLYDPKRLMPDTDVVVEEIIQAVKENPGTRIENLHNQGIVITGGSVSMSEERKIEIKEGNYNERIEGDYIEGNKTDRSRHQNISGGTINASGAGAFGLGDIYGTVANTINELPSSSNPKEPGIKELLTQLKESLDDPNLSEDDKEQTLGQLKVLAEAGKNPKDASRQKKAERAVSILEVIAKGVEPATLLAQTCTKVLPKILLFFGL